MTISAVGEPDVGAEPGAPGARPRPLELAGELVQNIGPDALELASDLIHSITRDGRIVYANRAWRERLGYDIADLPALSIDDVIHHDHVAHCRDVIARALAGENVGPVEIVLVARDGRQLPVEGLVARAGSGDSDATTLGVFRDVTERKRTLDLLRASEERFRTERDFNAAILNAAGSLLVVVDVFGRVLRFNRACEELSGYSREEVEGRAFWEVLGWGDPEIAGRLKQAFERRASASLPPSWEEYWVMRDGTRRLVSWSLSALQINSSSTEYFIASGVDITHQREQEEILRESEERFRSLFQHSIDAVLLTSPDGGIYAANPEACRIFGMTEEEICRAGRAGVVDQSDPRLPVYLEERRLTGKARGELTLRRADGSTFPGEISTSIFLDREGRQKTGMIIRDVTERKQAEEALRESEERFRRAFDDASIGMAQVGLDGRWLKVNRSLCEILGYSEVELLATDFQSLTHPDDLEADLDQVRAMVAGEIRTYQMEKRYFHRQGHVVWVLLSVSMVRDGAGRPMYFLSQVQDITGRKRAEDAQRLLVDAGTVLAPSIDYRTTLENVARLVVRSLADYCIMYLLEEDRQINRTAGAHSEPEKERLLADLLRYSPGQGVNDLVARVISTGEPLMMVEIPRGVLEAHAYDSTQLRTLLELDVRSGIIVPLEATGGVIGAMMLLLSGPERRYSGADLSLARDVARRVALALENARLFQQVKETLAGRDAMLSVVSHDMKNYLVAIGAFAQTLPELVPRDGSPANRQLLEGLAQIERGAGEMNHLVLDLMDFAGSQVGLALRLAKRPMDLVELTRNVVCQQQRTALQHTIVFETGETEFTGSWDGERISHMLVNLISNAVKYSPRGSEITVSLKRQQDETGRWAVLSVRDRGIGIPAKDLPGIFIRFTRAGNVGNVEGRGLGLYSVQQIVQMHGGSIGVESEEGIGSRFIVRLPANGA
ncbi:MAG TPA: PAS domain S-box protein [Chloroflexia bacterium]|nr:PAS domain S-box protein [Chloroflexia bacterium]